MNRRKKNSTVDANDEVEKLLRAAESQASSFVGKVEEMSHRKMIYKGGESDEVEELLRATEDAALLKLTVNSHTVHPSSSDLHPDLDQRFRNLKTGSKSKPKPESLTPKMVALESTTVNEEAKDDDLLSRFTALKASLPKPSSSISSSLVDIVPSSDLVGKDIGEDGEEDEVEKVIRWAMDAARLDPSPASDDEEDLDKNDNFDDSGESDKDADSPSGNQKGRCR